MKNDTKKRALGASFPKARQEEKQTKKTKQTSTRLSRSPDYNQDPFSAAAEQEVEA
jgi:hypothetical protein